MESAGMNFPELSILPRNRLNLLCPAGIGDTIWILSKLLPIVRERRAILWFPGGEQRRAGQYCDLLRLDYGYLPGLTSAWVWNQPGDPKLPQIGYRAVHANRHLEAGKHLSLWYPEYPLEYPHALGDPEPSSRRHAWRFMLAFLCHEHYMQGNLTPEKWARILERLGRSAPVRIVGAGIDIAFAKRVMRLMPGYAVSEPIFDESIGHVIAAARQAKAIIGVAGGPTIAAVCAGCPSLVAYPKWLAPMPGTWEPDASRARSCLVSELYDLVMDRGLKMDGGFNWQSV